MGFSIRHPLVAILLMVVMAAILAPLISRYDSPVQRPLDMELPPVPDLPKLDSLPPVSASEIVEAEQEISAARDQVRAGPAAQTEAGTGAEVGGLPVPAAWAVQVALIETPEQARLEKQRLLDSGYRAYLRVLPDNQGWQLFAGPELERAAAEQTLERLKFDPQWDIEGAIVPFSP